MNREPSSLEARRRILSVRGEPLLRADWHRVLMIHFEVDPARLQRDIAFPLDLRDGRAFVSLVAFTLCHLQPWTGGRIGSWLFYPIARHDFLNVRTYVKVEGEAGIHFLAEWVSSRIAVALGPRFFTLPYRHGIIEYDHDWQRGGLRGQVQGASRKLVLSYSASLATSKGEFAACRAGGLEEWLMERYSAFNCVGGRRRFFRVWHAPWRQCRAETIIEEDCLLLASWPWLREARLIGSNFSPGVTGVWMGRPQKVGYRNLPEHKPVSFRNNM